MANAVNMSFRVDKELKKQALPFTPNMNKPSKQLKKALKAAEDIASGETKTKEYHNIDTFIDDMTR